MYSDAELERAIEVVTKARKAARPTGKTRRVAEAKMKEHRCLLCDRQATRRGLCDAHYYRFRRTFNRLDEARQEVFEDRAVSEGKVLRSRQGQRGENPFAELVG